MGKYRILGAIALQAVWGCAHMFGADKPAFTEDEFDQLSTECDMAVIAFDAKKRLPADVSASSGEIGTRLVAQENHRELILYYDPYLLTDDPDTVIVIAGGARAIYNKRTCEHERTEFFR